VLALALTSDLLEARFWIISGLRLTEVIARRFGAKCRVRPIPRVVRQLSGSGWLVVLDLPPICIVLQ
jgi:hypothetical protein